MRNQPRLNKKIDDLQRQWELLNEKLSVLNEQWILENRGEEKLRLRKSIEETKTQRDQVEEQLKDMENRLGKVGSNAKEVAGRNDDHGRLRQQIQELQQRWDLLSQQITQLEHQRIVETRIEEKLRLKQATADAEAERFQVEQQLKALKSRLRMETGKNRFFIPKEPTLSPKKPKPDLANTGADNSIVNFLYRYRILAIGLSFGIIFLILLLFYSRLPNQLVVQDLTKKDRIVKVSTKIGNAKMHFQVWQIVHNEPRYKDPTPYQFQGEPGKQIDFELRFNGNRRRLTVTIPEDKDLECVYQMDEQPANQNHPYCPGATEVRGVPAD